MKVKVKVPPKQGVQAQSGSTGKPVALLIINFYARLGQAVNAMLLLPYSQERNSVYAIQEAEEAPGLVWTGVEKRACLALIGV